MNLGTFPFLERLAPCRSVLIAGAGGGFDVYSGLPLYFHLRERGKEVHLANLTFTRLEAVSGRRLGPGLVEVTAQSEGPASYFPEGALARWFAARGDSVPVFCFEKTGVKPLTRSYRVLAEELGFDALVLVDGGTDILMRGDEAGLGTPQEDITSLAAAQALPAAEKLVLCVGFGVDAFHGICHAHFLNGVAELSRAGAFLGVTSLLVDMPEVARYREAVLFSSERQPQRPSIVSLSVLSAVEGEYGDVHRTVRTAGSRLWINPLMSIYWGFDLGAVAVRCLYLESLRETETAFEAAAVIEAFRATCRARPWEEIPV